MSEDVLALTAQIVSAHVTKNTVEVGDLPALIRDVFRTLSSLGEAAPAPVAETAKPAVPAARSVFASHIICMECGKKMTMLKRHLMTEHGLTIDQYPDKVQFARHLSDGGAGLCQDAFFARQGNGTRQEPFRGAEEGWTPEVSCHWPRLVGVRCGQRPLNGRGLRFSLKARAASWKSSVKYSRIGAC